MSYTERHGAGGPTWACEEPGCTKRGNAKRYCPDHLERLPYVAQLVREVKRGAVETVSVECIECGDYFDRHKGVTKGAVCPACRCEREANNHRRRHAKKRAS